MKKYYLMVLFLALAQLSFAQNQDGKIMERIEAQKVAFFTQQLDLSVEESQAFWPIYNKYQEMEKDLRIQNKALGRNKNMTNAEASKMIDEFIDLEERQLERKKGLYGELREVIPPGKIVSLHFAEQQFKQKLLNQIKKRREDRKKR